jgi:hypothetical protein
MRKDTHEFRKMEITEFLELLKPKDCSINKDVMKTQVKEYLR